MASSILPDPARFSILPEGKPNGKPKPASIPVSLVTELLEEYASDAQTALQRSIIDGRWTDAAIALRVVMLMEELERRIDADGVRQ